MAIIFNGTNIPTNGDNMVYNGVKLTNVKYNNVEVWKKETKIIVVNDGTLVNNSYTSFSSGGRFFDPYTNLYIYGSAVADPYNESVYLTAEQTISFSQAVNGKTCTVTFICFASARSGDNSIYYTINGVRTDVALNENDRVGVTKTFKINNSYPLYLYSHYEGVSVGWGASTRVGINRMVIE